MALSRSNFFPVHTAVRDKIDNDITNVVTEDAITPSIHGEVLRGSGNAYSGDNIMRLFLPAIFNCTVEGGGYNLQAGWTTTHYVIAVLNYHGIANFYGQIKTTDTAGKLIMSGFPATPVRETRVVIPFMSSYFAEPAFLTFHTNGDVNINIQHSGVAKDVVIDFENVVLKVW